MHKRQRTNMHAGSPHDPSQGPVPHPVSDDSFIQDNDAADSAGEEEDEEDTKRGSDKNKQGRRKIKIEFISDKSRRHITFSKRKAGIMKKAYELSTLTGTQVLLLVVSETGLVYTFTTAKLQPLVTQPEGKNLIQACLNAPHGSLPSSMPVGPPIGRASGPAPGAPGAPSNLPGGLSIGGGGGAAAVQPKDDEDQGEEEDTAPHGGRANAGDKRRRRAGSTSGSSNPRASGPTSPGTAHATVGPPPLNIPASSNGPQSSHPGQPQSQLPLGSSPTSPPQQHAQTSPAPYSAGGSGGSYSGHDIYSNHNHGQQMMTPGGYAYSGNHPPGGAHWPQNAQQQQYGRR